jgi:hypothetical protein
VQAILGDKPVVDNALSLLLEGFGYSTMLIEAHPTRGASFLRASLK